MRVYLSCWHQLPNQIPPRFVDLRKVLDQTLLHFVDRYNPLQTLDVLQNLHLQIKQALLRQKDLPARALDQPRDHLELEHRLACHLPLVIHFLRY